MAAQCATSAVLFGASDVVAQQMVGKVGIRNHDVRSPSTFIPHIPLLTNVAVPKNATSNVLRRYALFHGLILPRRQLTSISPSPGALFGPAVTKWFQLLNRLKFSSPVKGTIFRVRSLSPSPTVSLPHVEPRALRRYTLISSCSRLVSDLPCPTAHCL